MKAREMRLRRAAERQGMTLVKSRRRDQRSIGFGRWCLRSRWGDERVVGFVPGGLALVDAPAEAKKLARDKCQRAKGKRISEEEARIAAVDAEWQKCLNAARWWPLLYGDAEEYCADWHRVKIGLESALESARGWSC